MADLLRRRPLQRRGVWTGRHGRLRIGELLHQGQIVSETRRAPARAGRPARSTTTTWLRCPAPLAVCDDERRMPRRPDAGNGWGTAGEGDVDLSDGLSPPRRTSASG